ncbi:MAG: hypothetical protein IMF12_04960, partial [Proteobacteria bacterium]|nr:hypothetical protein [Pseudomonadota bacterium]
MNFKSIILVLLFLFALPATAKPDADKTNNGKASEHTNASDDACEKGNGSFCGVTEPPEVISDVTKPIEVIPDVIESPDVISDITKPTEVIHDVTESTKVIPDVTESTDAISDSDEELKITFGMSEQDSIIEIYTLNDESIEQRIDELELVGMTNQGGTIEIRRFDGVLNKFSTSFNNDDT